MSCSPQTIPNDHDPDYASALFQSRLLGDGEPVYALLAPGNLVVVTDMFDDEADPTTVVEEAASFVGYDLASGTWWAFPPDMIVTIGTDIQRRDMH